MGNKELKRYAAELPMRLSDHMLPETKVWVDWVLTPTQQLQIERGLHSVIRMDGLREKGFPVPPNFQQSNLIHEGNILKDAKELGRTKPALASHLDIPRVQIFGYGHDIPEILDKVGDVQPTNRTPRDHARKRLEHFAAKAHLIPQIVNPIARADALERYIAYEKGDPHDLDVQMAKYLDQKDGTISYAHIVFNRFSVESQEVFARMRLHLFETLPKLIVPAVNLLVNLPSLRAREEMRDVLLEDLSTLDKYAPKGVASPFIERFAS